MHHDLAWWGVVLAVVALVLMFPASICANMVTPILLNWFASWGKKSLAKRISKFEKKLADLEVNPPIDEVQNQILWGLTSIRIKIDNAVGNLIALAYLGAVFFLPQQNSEQFKSFAGLALFILTLSMFDQFRLRYTKDWRYKHSPKVREYLRKEIAEMKEMQRKHGWL